jgi:uncharacterized protein DUF4255/carboxypeptidase family protein
MIDKADQQLREWVSSVVRPVETVLSLPDDQTKGIRIGLYLMDLAQAPTPRGTKRPPLQVWLRYLVTAWSPQPEEAHRLLGELLFAALEKPETEPPEFEVITEPLPVEVWTALGTSPRPSFFLRMPLRRERTQKQAPLVRTPLVISGQMSHLDGIVYGPESIPIMGARVEVAALRLSTHTDAKGRFHFAALPSSAPISLKVQAKGKEINLSLTPSARRDEPLEIRLQGLEE